MRRPLRAVLLLAATLTACGPEVSLQVNLREPATDVTYGGKATPLPSPVAQIPAVVSPAFPGLVPVPSTVYVDVPAPAFAIPSAAATPNPCPDAAQLASPALEASSGVPGMPAAATYRFRRAGDVTQGGRPKQNLAGEVTRTVNAGTPNQGPDPSAPPGFRYAMVEKDGDTTTTITYEVDNPGNVDTVSARTETAGLKIAQVTVSRPGQAPVSFSPAAPLRFFGLPANVDFGPAGEQAVDPVGGETASINRDTGGKTTVNACGQVIAAWSDGITGTLQDTGSQKLTITATLQVATQYGALIVGEDVVLDGTGADGKPYHLHSNCTIDQVPQPVATQ